MATQIQQRQIADSAINDNKIQAGANIQTSKLQDGPNFIKKDGSVAFTGNISMGGQILTNLGTPLAGTDAVNKQTMDNAIANALSPFNNKGTVKAATTGNITLLGTQTIDGITLIAGDRVLVKNQTTPSQNGLYTVSATSWSRTTDMDSWTEIPGAWITVQQGTTQADTIWLGTADQGGVLNTTSVTFVNPLANVGLQQTNFIDKEIPAGSINGSNTTYTLANIPIVGSEHVYLNGILQESGAGNDYTITGASLTMITAPLTGEKIRVSYRK